MRYEKAGHDFRVGDVVREKFGARTFGRVVGFMSFEGSGLVFEDAILVCESLEARARTFEVAHGGAEKAVRS